MSMMFMDGYDDCILGVCERFGAEDCVAYDKSKVISKLMEDGMTEEEALEFFYFNMVGAYVGEQTPVFITLGDVVIDEEV